MTSKHDDDEGRIALADDAPPVDLTLLIVENKGVEIASHPEMGRVIVATRDFDSDLLHTPILREQPALVCNSMDYMNFMEEFLDAPVEIQVGLLDMFYQPLDSPMGRSLIEPAKILFLLGVLEDFRVIHQLLAISMTNGHQYPGNRSAIPLFATKFSHSCNPNVGYSSSAADGCMEYKLLRPIQKGELVSFSYLADLFETPTKERRQLLMDTKSFVCQCERCMGPDYCRCQRCPACSQMLPCRYTYDDSSSEPYWECPNCGMLEPFPLLRVERELETTLQVMDRATEQTFSFNDRCEYTPSVLQEIVRECMTSLSPTHHLTIKALRTLVKVSTTNAYVQIKKLIVRGLPLDNPRVHSLFRISVDAGFQLVLACECVASDCTGCYWNSSNDLEDYSSFKIRRMVVPHHEPNYDRATPMRHMCEALLQLPIYWWPPCAWTMTKRYLPILKAKLGPIADDLERGIVQAWENVTCLECGTHWDGGPKVYISAE